MYTMFYVENFSGGGGYSIFSSKVKSLIFLEHGVRARSALDTCGDSDDGCAWRFFTFNGFSRRLLLGECPHVKSSLSAREPGELFPHGGTSHLGRGGRAAVLKKARSAVIFLHTLLICFGGVL